MGLFWPQNIWKINTYMLIGNFLKNIKKEFRNHQFAGLSFNSANCKKDYIFFAIKGTKSDGNKFIDHAIKKGAKTIISEQKFEGIKNKVLFLRSKNNKHANSILILVVGVPFLVDFKAPALPRASRHR